MAFNYYVLLRKYKEVLKLLLLEIVKSPLSEYCQKLFYKLFKITNLVTLHYNEIGHTYENHTPLYFHGVFSDALNQYTFQLDSLIYVGEATP